MHHSHAHGTPALWDSASAGHLALGLLLSYLVTAVLHAAWESRLPADQTPRQGAWRQALTGAWAGLTVAECSCGVVPLYRRLLQRHAGRTQALAFLFAAPLWGFSSLVLSWWMLGTRITMLRAGAALLLAVVTALLTHLVTPNTTSDEADLPSEPIVPGPHSHRGRIADALHFTLGEVLDRSSPWALFGLVLAQLAGSTHLEALHGSYAEVLLFALIATPFYLSATAATVVGCVLLAAGVSVGAVLAFLLLSSALGLGTISLIKRQYGTQVCAWVTVGAWVVAVILGMGVPPAWSDAVTNPAPQGLEQTIGMGALVCVAALFLFSLLRQGVRPFLGQVALPNTMRTHSHHHDHGDPAHAHV